MKTLIYSAKDFEIPFLEEANKDVHTFKYITDRLTTNTAMMALGFEAISIFSADDAENKPKITTSPLISLLDLILKIKQ